MDSSEDGECTSNVDDINAVPCPIRKRRFSNARIQPTRVKKVMQSDEEIGRMVASVPVAIGSAMEHFAEKLLEAASACVPDTTSRTLSPMHIKYAIMRNSHFAFLEPLVKDIKLPKNTDGLLVSASATDVACHSASSRYAHFPKTANNFGGPSTSGSSSLLTSMLATANKLPPSATAHSLASVLAMNMAGFRPGTAGSFSSTTSNVFTFPNAGSPHSPQSAAVLTGAKNLPLSQSLNYGNGDKKRKRGRPRIDRPNVGSDFPSPASHGVTFMAQRPATQNGDAHTEGKIEITAAECRVPPLKRPSNGSTDSRRSGGSGLSTIFEHDDGTKASADGS